LRLQTRAYVLAHGGDPDAMSEDDFRLIMVSYADGIIGNKKVINTLGSLTAGVFNYLRSNNSKTYSLEDIIGTAYDYIYPPLTEEQKQHDVNQRLKSFMQSRPGAETYLKK
jgi:hypothetical protein